MKSIVPIVIPVLLLSACATGKSYSTRSDLQNDPGTKTELVFKMPVKNVYPILRDMTTACLETKQVRASGEKPDADGRGASITLTTLPSIVKSRILVTTNLDPTEDGGTRATVYYAGEDAPKGLLEKYRRWLEEGATTCANSPP